jgi:predicted exporter
VGSRGAADLAAALTVRGALASTAALVGCFGVLCAADLGAAREVGLGIASGALLDLVLARGPFLGILARWGH